MIESTSHPVALSYDRGARPYIPPYFAERGKGPVASVVKIIAAALLLLCPGGLFALIGMLAVSGSSKDGGMAAVIGLLLGGMMIWGGVCLLRQPISSIRRWLRSRRYRAD